MVWIPGGTFIQGAAKNDLMAMSHEKPAHRVRVNGFYMDVHEVTNQQFDSFVKATNYITVAERAIRWEELSKQLPPNTPKPPDSLLQPGSLIFRKSAEKLPNLIDFSQWWSWKIGANWRNPKGLKEPVQLNPNDPVVHIAYEDAVAFAKWKGHRLPTEAEWEYASKAGGIDPFFWGADKTKLSRFANTWEGQFPYNNSQQDGYEGIAPVKSYQPNAFGLYDMAGNVWEWTSDWYDARFYEQGFKPNEIANNPKGPPRSVSANPYAQEKVIKGGSFLCSESYCASFRSSARMGASIDSGMEHLGFRTVWVPGE